MISEEKRNEVWNRNKPYMDSENVEETAVDLLPMCRKCPKFRGISNHDFETCRGEACFELWLSNEYLEWCASYG